MEDSYSAAVNEHTGEMQVSVEEAAKEVALLECKEQKPFVRELVLFFLISTLTWGGFSVMNILIYRDSIKQLQFQMQQQSERLESAMVEFDKRFTAIPVYKGEVPINLPKELPTGDK